jgi:hypothetical protein
MAKFFPFSFYVSDFAVDCFLTCIISIRKQKVRNQSPFSLRYCWKFEWAATMPHPLYRFT